MQPSVVEPDGGCVISRVRTRAGSQLPTTKPGKQTTLEMKVKEIKRGFGRVNTLSIDGEWNELCNPGDGGPVG